MYAIVSSRSAHLVGLGAEGPQRATHGAAAVPPLFVREPEPVDCTGPYAVWCPNCGDCSCVWDDTTAYGSELVVDEACCLHGPHDNTYHGRYDQLLYESPVWDGLYNNGDW